MSILDDGSLGALEYLHRLFARSTKDLHSVALIAKIVTVVTPKGVILHYSGLAIFHLISFAENSAGVSLPKVTMVRAWKSSPGES